jgi:hypothetical protein
MTYLAGYEAYYEGIDLDTYWPSDMKRGFEDAQKEDEEAK